VSDSTAVDVQAVLDFAGVVQQHASDQPQTLAALGSAQLANLGASGMQEGAWAAGSHAAALDAALQFLSETADGLQSLAWVAVTVAENYRFGDADQAAQMAGVDAAFRPAPGQPSLATERAEAEAEAAAAAADAARRAEFFRLSGEAPPQDQPTTAPASPQGPPAAGASTVGDGPESTRYGRYASEVSTHRAFVAGGDGPSAEDDYDPRGDHTAAVEEAERKSEENRIPYVVQVDDEGNSEVVQADPDDIPYVAPLTYAEVSTPAVPSPSVLSYGG
jgi:hypothetical protein